MGCVTQVGEQALNVGRVASLVAGWPETVCATTVDRQCGSSMQAALNAASAIQAGHLDLVVAAGIENMSRVPMGSNLGEAGWAGFSEKLARAVADRPAGDLGRGDRGGVGADAASRSTSTRYESHMRAVARDRRGTLRAARSSRSRSPTRMRGRPVRGRRDAAPRHVAREDGGAAAGVQGGRGRHGRELERDRRRLGGDAGRERGARVGASGSSRARASSRSASPASTRTGCSTATRRRASARSRRRGSRGTTWP